MGNWICRLKRSTVEERFTRPQRLVRQPSNVDYKKLRKLIRSRKLAPCFDGVEDSSNPDFEECPICFFYYPSLNRSRCCLKGICTECFLQMNPSNATHSAQCPFCKFPSYAVEYRGPRTQEEKGREQAEEQKVIEAKIRMQFEESRNTDEVILANQDSPISDPRELSNGEGQELANSELSLANGSIEATGSPLNAWNERPEEFGLDLEEVMMMEAIWQSIQDPSIQKGRAQQSSRSIGINGTHSETQLSNHSGPSLALTGQTEFPFSNEVTGGIAVAIARLAERNVLRPGTSRQIYECYEANQIQGETTVGENPTESENASEATFSSSATEDASWESLSSGPFRRNQCSENGSISDEDLATEGAIDVESSHLSSVHTISDVSCGSPVCSDTGGSPRRFRLGA